MLVGSAGYALATFCEGSVYVSWHGLTNPDLDRCHLNASVVALTALGIVASIVLKELEGAVGQALSMRMVAGSRGGHRHRVLTQHWRGGRVAIPVSTA
jgi:hypothetical protein